MKDNAAHIDQETDSENTHQKIENILADIPDPEIPVLTLHDLGIVRDVRIENNEIEVIITPTYSGCPAMDFIAMNIHKTLAENGFRKVKITHQLSPAWTTDWMTNEAKEKLRAYGIAPPVGKTADSTWLKKLPVPCPHCNSKNTELVSEFGSTPCKSIYRCLDCKEPFDHFKCH